MSVQILGSSLLIAAVAAAVQLHSFKPSPSSLPESSASKRNEFVMCSAGKSCLELSKDPFTRCQLGSKKCNATVQLELLQHQVVAKQ